MAIHTVISSELGAYSNMDSLIRQRRMAKLPIFHFILGRKEVSLWYLLALHQLSYQYLQILANVGCFLGFRLEWALARGQCAKRGMSVDEIVGAVQNYKSCLKWGSRLPHLGQLPSFGAA